MYVWRYMQYRLPPTNSHSLGTYTNHPTLYTNNLDGNCDPQPKTVWLGSMIKLQYLDWWLHNHLASIQQLHCTCTIQLEIFAGRKFSQISIPILVGEIFSCVYDYIDGMAYWWKKFHKMSLQYKGTCSWAWRNFPPVNFFGYTVWDTPHSDVH